MMDEWTELLEDGGQIDTLYTDLEKAFDKVPHKLLCHKLLLYGFDKQILSWIEAFLKCRMQRVRVGNSYSEWIPVISGIPQGSVLGPVLFIIYINDLVYCGGEDLNIYLYADDAKIFRYIREKEDCQFLQDDINKVVDWFNKNFMKLNIEKCKVVSYGRDILEQKYVINNVMVERADSIKDLGVVFDSKLKFDKHIREKVNKASAMLGIIKRNFSNLSPESYVILYKSLVRSHLEYAE